MNHSDSIDQDALTTISDVRIRQLSLVLHSARVAAEKGEQHVCQRAKALASSRESVHSCGERTARRILIHLGQDPSSA